jgi:hypothetical protein
MKSKSGTYQIQMNYDTGSLLFKKDLNLLSYYMWYQFIVLRAIIIKHGKA